MRIGIFSPSWPPGSDPNGIVTYVGNLVPALRKLAHEVFIVTHNAFDGDRHVIDLRSYKRPLPIWHRALFKIAPDAAMFQAAAQPLVSAIKYLVANHGIELFEMEETYGLSAAVSELRIIPVVVRLHGPWFINKRNSNSLDVKREEREGTALAAASAITSPSSRILDVVRNYYHIGPTKGCPLFNPIAPADKGRLWKLDMCDRNGILFVGRFDEIKGGDLVLRAFNILAVRYPNLRLTFVGPDHGIPFGGRVVGFAEYSKSVLSSDVRSRVSFLGPVHHSQVDDYRRGHFVTICASQIEILPYSILEAMSLGCPIVATSVGGIPEIIRSGENGTLVQSGDAEAMANAIEGMINHPDLAQALGLQARRDSLEFFSAEALAAETVRIYERTIADFKR